jgi:hypothetical protein
MRRRRAACAAVAVALAGAGAAGAAPAVVREQKIYPGSSGNDASLAAGWNNFSWRGAYDLNSTAVPPFRGAACAQAQPQLYGALSFYTRSPFAGASRAAPVRGFAPVRVAARSRRSSSAARAPRQRTRHASARDAWRAAQCTPRNAHPCTRTGRASVLTQNACATPRALLCHCTAGPTAADGWDAVDFWMRGRDALSITVFVLPAASSAAGGGAGGTAAAAAVPTNAAALTTVETVGRAAAALVVDTSPFSAGRAGRSGTATARGTRARAHS